MTSFMLKIIAIITMFCDHFGDAFVGHFSSLNLIGRIAFPIFAFQISQGYIYTSNIKKYVARLLLFALISQIPFYLFLHKFLPTSTTYLNIFFTLLLGLICIMVYDRFRNLPSLDTKSHVFNTYFSKFLGIILVFCIAYLGELLHVDYGFWGVIVIFSFYLFKEYKLSMIIAYILLCVIRYGYNLVFINFHLTNIYLCISTIFPIILLANYNGKQGYKMKYFLYFFYPVHLLLLYFFIPFSQF